MSLRLLLLLGLVVCMPSAIGAASADLRSDGGMVNWPQAEMAHALEIIVPERMAMLRIPGVAIAIVKDGRPVFLGHFGIADRRHDQVIEAGSQFEAGALGNVVTTYAAATMMRDKLLFLDAPLSRDLNARWIKNQKEDAAVTLRLVLAHMSGLGDNPVHPSGQLRAEPGTRFLHSGEGFVYLQHVMESVSHRSFETLMQDRVFRPLDMTQSTFLDRPQVIVRGHVPLSMPLIAFYLPLFAGFLVALVVTIGVLRFVYDTHRPQLMHMIFPVMAAILTAIATVWLNMGFAMMVLIGLIAITFGLLLGLFAYGLTLVLPFIGLGDGTDGVVLRGQREGSARAHVLVACLSVLIALPLLHVTLPVMRLPFGQVKAPNAALTFQTSAEDMSRFMIELLEGDKIGKAMTGQIFSQQVRIGPDKGRALGLGLQRNQNRITYWERGSTTGFESLMVLEPARDTGLVVLTNSSEGASLAQEMARHILGIETRWALP